MIGALFGKFQHRAQQRDHEQQHPHRVYGKRNLQLQSMQNGKTAEDRNKLRAQKAERPHQNGECHKPGQRLDEMHHAEKDFPFALFFHLTPPPFRSFQALPACATDLHTHRFVSAVRHAFPFRPQIRFPCSRSYPHPPHWQGGGKS